MEDVLYILLCIYSLRSPPILPRQSDSMDQTHSFIDNTLYTERHSILNLYIMYPLAQQNLKYSFEKFVNILFKACP